MQRKRIRYSTQASCRQVNVCILFHAHNIWTYDQPYLSESWFVMFFAKFRRCIDQKTLQALLCRGMETRDENEINRHDCRFLNARAQCARYLFRSKRHSISYCDTGFSFVFVSNEISLRFVSYVFYRISCFANNLHLYRLNASEFDRYAWGCLELI